MTTSSDSTGAYYDALNTGGVFYNADVVLASSDSLQAVYMDRWRAFMSRGVSETEIDGNWLPK
jgi:tRNA (cmo5U34)-methyltransferase